jgi:hypothetical protein
MGGSMMAKLIYFGAVFVLSLGMALVCMADFLKGRRPLKSEILGALGIVFGLLATWLLMMVLLGVIK